MDTTYAKRNAKSGIMANDKLKQRLRSARNEVREQNEELLKHISLKL